MREVMRRAWDIARKAVETFGGAVKSYIAEALRMAWAEKKRTTLTVKEWFGEKLINEAHSYNLYVARTYGKSTISFHLSQPVLAETEKAIKVKVDAYTRGDNYREYTSWIPKSVLA